MSILYYSIFPYLQILVILPFLILLVIALEFAIYIYNWNRSIFKLHYFMNSESTLWWQNKCNSPSHSLYHCCHLLHSYLSIQEHTFTYYVYIMHTYVSIIKYIVAIIILNKLLSVRWVKNQKYEGFYFTVICFFFTVLPLCRSEFLICIILLFSNEGLWTSLARQVYWQQIPSILFD